MRGDCATFVLLVESGAMSEDADIRVVLCTFPDREQARQIGAALVERRLAACVSLLDGVESIYRWQGAVHHDPEVLAIIKTTASAFPTLEKALTELHPYEVPEVIALPVAAGAGPYLHWVREQVEG